MSAVGRAPRALVAVVAVVLLKDTLEASDLVADLVGLAVEVPGLTVDEDRLVALDLDLEQWNGAAVSFES